MYPGKMPFGGNCATHMIPRKLLMKAAYWLTWYQRRQNGDKKEETLYQPCLQSYGTPGYRLMVIASRDS